MGGSWEGFLWELCPWECTACPTCPPARRAVPTQCPTDMVCCFSSPPAMTFCSPWAAKRQGKRESRSPGTCRALGSPRCPAASLLPRLAQKQGGKKWESRSRAASLWSPGPPGNVSLGVSSPVILPGNLAEALTRGHKNAMHFIEYLANTEGIRASPRRTPSSRATSRLRPLSPHHAPAQMQGASKSSSAPPSLPCPAVGATVWMLVGAICPMWEPQSCIKRLPEEFPSVWLGFAPGMLFLLSLVFFYLHFVFSNGLRSLIFFLCYRSSPFLQPLWLFPAPGAAGDG